MNRMDIRLALPSKGRLSVDALDLLEKAGLRVHHPNPRQYIAEIPSLPGLVVVFQRPGDIVIGVREGSVDFGITGWDVVSELRGTNGQIVPMQRALGFGHCRLHVIVPESMSGVENMSMLRAYASGLRMPLRVATKYPNLTRSFFEKAGLEAFKLITAEGTLEIAPHIGYADVIVDLVSTGTTLRDNRLKVLSDGMVIESEAALIANRKNLVSNRQVLSAARTLLEFTTAHLRAKQSVLVTANVRNAEPRAIADAMFSQPHLCGLQGPTISPVLTREGGSWHAVNIIVRKRMLPQAIAELRSIGGSGVIVTPLNYIFEEEPEEYRQLLAAIDVAAPGGNNVENI